MSASRLDRMFVVLALCLAGFPFAVRTVRADDFLRQLGRTLEQVGRTSASPRANAPHPSRLGSSRGAYYRVPRYRYKYVPRYTTRITPQYKTRTWGKSGTSTVGRDRTTIVESGEERTFAGFKSERVFSGYKRVRVQDGYQWRRRPYVAPRSWPRHQPSVSPSRPRLRTFPGPQPTHHTSPPILAQPRKNSLPPANLPTNQMFEGFSLTGKGNPDVEPDTDYYYDPPTENEYEEHTWVEQGPSEEAESSAQGAMVEDSIRSNDDLFDENGAFNPTQYEKEHSSSGRDPEGSDNSDRDSRTARTETPLDQHNPAQEDELDSTASTSAGGGGPGNTSSGTSGSSGSGANGGRDRSNDQPRSLEKVTDPRTGETFQELPNGNFGKVIQDNGGGGDIIGTGQQFQQDPETGEFHELGKERPSDDGKKPRQWPQPPNASSGGRGGYQSSSGGGYGNGSGAGYQSISGGGNRSGSRIGYESGAAGGPRGGSTTGYQHGSGSGGRSNSSGSVGSNSSGDNVTQNSISGNKAAGSGITKNNIPESNASEGGGSDKGDPGGGGDGPCSHCGGSGLCSRCGGSG